MQREVNGIRMAYEEAGSGTALVLLHGFPLTREMWRAHLAALGDRARVIALDLPGFGESDRREPASIDGFADDVRALLGSLGVEEAVIAGHSMGGYVALRLVDLNPELVRGLILVDTRAEADSPEARERRLAGIDRVRREGPAGFVGEFTANLAGPTTKARHPAVVEHLRALGAQASGPSVIAALQALADRPDSTRNLARIRVPTLIVHGQEDTVIPLEAAQALRRGISGSELVVVPAAGHTPPVEQPDAFSQAVRDFLRTLEEHLPASP